MKRIFPATHELALAAFFSIFWTGNAVAGMPSEAEAPLEIEKKSTGTRTVFSVVDDNDFFGHWSDKYYTNHTRFALTLGSSYKDNFHHALFFSLGQEIYSPKDRAATIPDPKDHPYAGYLYASFGDVKFDDDFSLAKEIQIGATGDYSLGEKVQREYHRLINEIRPAGWETQIHDRFVMQFIGDVRKRFVIDGETGRGSGSDVIVRGFCGIGNLRGEASIGAELRAGLNLPKDFGSPSLRQSASVNFDPQVDFSIYGFWDLQLDAIFWDETLTGNNDSGADIYAYPFVAQASIGVSAVYKNFKVSIFQAVRSRDFESQDRDFFIFGGFKCSVFF